MSFPTDQQVEVPMEVDDLQDVDVEMELLVDGSTNHLGTKQGTKRGTEDRPTENIADEPQAPPPLKRRKKKGAASEKTASESDSAISSTSVASRLRSSNRSVDATIPLASAIIDNDTTSHKQPTQVVADNSTNETQAADEDATVTALTIAPVDSHHSSTVATSTTSLAANQTRTTADKPASVSSVKPRNTKKSKPVEKSKAIKASRVVKPRLAARTAMTRAVKGNNSRVPRVDRRVKSACRDLAFVVTTAACCGLAAFPHKLKQPAPLMLQQQQKQQTQILRPTRMNNVPSRGKLFDMLDNKAKEKVASTESWGNAGVPKTSNVEADLFLLYSSPQDDVDFPTMKHDKPQLLVEETSVTPITVTGAVAQRSTDELLLVHSSSPGDVDVAAMAHDESMETTGTPVTTTEAVVQGATGGRLEETAPVAWILSVPTLDVVQAEVAYSNSSSKVVDQTGPFWNEPLVNVSGVVELVPAPDRLASHMVSGQKALPIGSLKETDWIDQFVSEVGDLLVPVKSALMETAPVGKQQPNTALDWLQLGLYWMEDFVCEPDEEWCHIVSGTDFGT